jgi:hypothetical protein
MVALRALGVIGLALILGLALSIAYYSTLPQASFSPKIKGTIEVEKNGQLVYQGDDLLTTYFYKWFACILNGGAGQPTGYQTSSARFYFASSEWTTDVGSITYGTTTFPALTSPNNLYCMTDKGDTSSTSSRVWVGIGSGTGTVTRNDKALFNKIGYAAGSVGFTSLAAQGKYNVSVAGSITLASAATITETSLVLVTCISTGGGSNSLNCPVDFSTNAGYTAIMLDHSTITPISGNTGDVITVRYVLQFVTNAAGIAWMVANLFSGVNDFSGGVITANNVFYGQARGWWWLGCTTCTHALDTVYITLDQPVIQAVQSSPLSCSGSATSVSVQLNLQSQQINVYGGANNACGAINFIGYNARFTGGGSSGVNFQIASTPAAGFTPTVSITAGQAVGLQFTGP